MSEIAGGRRRRRRVRRGPGRLAPRPASGRGHADRSTQLPPVRASGLPGGDRRAVPSGNRLSAEAHVSASPNVRVLLAEAIDVDLDARRVRLREVAGQRPLEAVPDETPIVAMVAQSNYFDHDRRRVLAPNLRDARRSLARSVGRSSGRRSRGARARSQRRASWLTFVVVGARAHRGGNGRSDCRDRAGPATANSVGPVPAKLRSCWSKPATGSCRSFRRHRRRGRNDPGRSRCDDPHSTCADRHRRGYGHARGPGRCST